MIVFIDRQHAGKPDKPEDRGASIEPAPSFGLGMEALYTGYLSLMIEERLLENGAKVIPISDGKYPDRHKRVNEYSKRFQGEKQVYLSLHLNAGGGDYSSFFHMGSENGASLAALICDKMREASLPGLSRCLPKPCSSEDWTKNAWYTLRGVDKPVAICCEPLFMDTHRDLLTMESLRVIAGAIANGIISWSL